MYFWTILSYIDTILFILVALTVAYMGVFALLSMMSKNTEPPKSRKENRFIILIPAYKNGAGTLQTVHSILGQTYPQRLFDVTVISDHLDEMSNFRLAQEPITLLTPVFQKSSRAKSLQVAINNLPQFKLYDIVVILNPGSIVEPEFLMQMNDAYEAAGTRAIQAHRMSKNRDTAPARLSSIFDKTSWDDKELEMLLLRQHIYVDYFDNIVVLEEKVRLAEDFNRQRRRWLVSQVETFIRNIHYLPGAILNRHYDLIDKILQWMLLPRMIMMAVIVFMGILMPHIYFTLALKWWMLFAVVLLIFALATPNYLVDDKWNRTFFMIPIIFLSSLLAKTPLGPKLKRYVNKKN